jgi:hypothetical protein
MYLSEEKIMECTNLSPFSQRFSPPSPNFFVALRRKKLIAKVSKQMAIVCSAHLLRTCSAVCEFYVHPSSCRRGTIQKPHLFESDIQQHAFA